MSCSNNFVQKIAPPPVQSAPLSKEEQPKTTTFVPPSVAIRNLNADKKEAIKGIKKAMVKTMNQANSIPHFSYCDEYNMDQLVKLRHHLKSVGKERGANISYMPILIKACSIALHSYPILNAHVDEKCENITYKVGLFYFSIQNQNKNPEFV